MEISPELIFAGCGILFSGGVAWGIMKGGMSSYVKHSDHRTICHDKSDETNKKIDLLFKKVDTASTEIHDIVGYIRGKSDAGHFERHV